MHVLLVAAIGLVTYAIYRFYRWYVYSILPIINGSSSLPNPPKHWLFGNLIDHPGMSEACLNWWADAAAKCGPVFRLFHGLEPQAYLSHPETAKEFLRSGEPKPINVPGYGVIIPWLGNGIIVSKGAQWHRNRHLLTPAFHFEMLKNYIKVFSKASDKMVALITNRSQQGEPLNIFPPASLYSLDAILRCVFSMNEDVQESGGSQPIVKLTQEALNIMLRRCYNPIYYPELIWCLSPLGRRYSVVCKQFNDISRGIISARKQELEESLRGGAKAKKHHDFLEILLKAKDEDGDGMTEDEIRAEANSVLFAGHDTTSSAISWTLYELAMHPEHQAKCRAEIDEILKDRDGDDLDWEDISKMKHLSLCVKESMRLNTTVPIISRYATRDYEIDGRVIPKGMIVNIMLYLIHRQPDVWGDPDTFRPERFLLDEVTKRDTYAYAPFSAGPRNCIGQNFALNAMKVLLSKIVLNFKVGVDGKRPPRKLPEASLKTEDGMWLTFDPVDRL